MSFFDTLLFLYVVCWQNKIILILLILPGGERALSGPTEWIMRYYKNIPLLFTYNFASKSSLSVNISRQILVSIPVIAGSITPDAGISFAWYNRIKKIQNVCCIEDMLHWETNARNESKQNIRKTLIIYNFKPSVGLYGIGWIADIFDRLKVGQ